MLLPGSPGRFRRRAGRATARRLCPNIFLGASSGIDGLATNTESPTVTSLGFWLLKVEIAKTPLSSTSSITGSTPPMPDPAAAGPPEQQPPDPCRAQAPSSSAFFIARSHRPDLLRISDAQICVTLKPTRAGEEQSLRLGLRSFSLPVCVLLQPLLGVCFVLSQDADVCCRESLFFRGCRFLPFLWMCTVASSWMRRCIGFLV